MRALANGLLWVGLGGWIGAMVLFAAVVAPAAFATLPSPELAGPLVGRVLGVLHLAGAGLGVGLALLAALLGRGRMSVLLAMALAAVCLVSHFGVSAPLSEMRDLAGADPETVRRFGTLHRISVSLFGVTLAGALLLAALHARADARERTPGAPSWSPAARRDVPKKTSDFP